jgi:hypothetical protein
MQAALTAAINLPMPVSPQSPINRATLPKSHQVLVVLLFVNGADHFARRMGEAVVSESTIMALFSPPPCGEAKRYASGTQSGKGHP